MKLFDIIQWSLVSVNVLLIIVGEVFFDLRFPMSVKVLVCLSMLLAILSTD